MEKPADWPRCVPCPYCPRMAATCEDKDTGFEMLCGLCRRRWFVSQEEAERRYYITAEENERRKAAIEKQRSRDGSRKSDVRPGSPFHGPH